MASILCDLAKRSFCFVLVVLWTGAASAGEMRTWKASEGDFQVEAELIAQSETLVKLKKKDGTELNVPREKLSKQDLDYLLFADPPLSKFAAPGKQDSTAKPEPTVTESKTNTQSPTTNTTPNKSSDKVNSTGDTYESIQRSFDKDFDPKANPEKQPTLPISPGTNIPALVKELYAPLVPTEFVLKHEHEIPVAGVMGDDIHSYTKFAEGGVYFMNRGQAGLEVWNVETGVCETTWKYTKNGHANSHAYAISPRGAYLARIPDDNTVEVYDVRAKKLLRTIELAAEHGTGHRVKFNWPEKNVYILTTKGYLETVSLQTGEIRSFDLQEKMLGEFRYAEDKTYDFSKDLNNDFMVNPEGRCCIPLRYKHWDTPGKYLIVTPGDAPFINYMKHEHAPNIISSGRTGYLASNHSMMVRGQEFAEQDPGTFATATRTTRSQHVRDDFYKMQTDRLEQYVWSCNHQRVHFTTTKYLGQPVSWTVPNAEIPNKSRFFWISAEKQRYIEWYKGKFSVYDLKTWSVPPEWRVYSVVTQAFLQKRYDFLDGFFAEIGTLDRPLPESYRDFPLRSAVDSLTEPQMYIAPQEWFKRLVLWQQERPDSHAARLVLARALIKQGWAARGPGRANTVTAEGFARFHQAGIACEELLKPLLAQKQPWVHAFVLQAELAQLLSRKPEEQIEIAKRATELYPRALLFHDHMAFNLLPRWFGEPGDSMAYAEKVADLVGGDQGEMLYACIAKKIAEAETLNDPQALGLDTNRVTRGFLKGIKQEPESSRYYLLLIDWQYKLRYKSIATDPELMKEHVSSVKKFQKILDQQTFIPELYNNDVRREIYLINNNKLK